MDIVFIRHGTTNVNLSGRFGGFLDQPLCKEGINEIYEASKKIAGESFDEVFTSPLKRSVETLDILGFKGKTDDRLREVNFGIFEGMNYQEIQSKFPEETKKWTEDYLNYRIPKGESLMDLYERVGDFLTEVSKSDGKILAATHEGVIRCALSWVFENPNYFYKFKANHGEFTTISISDGYRFIKGINTNSL